jgi:transcriptional regulator with PAS, ATPase and Fis domain
VKNPLVDRQEDLSLLLLLLLLKVSRDPSRHFSQFSEAAAAAAALQSFVWKDNSDISN